MNEIVRTRSPFDEARRRTRRIQSMLMLRDPEAAADPAPTAPHAYSGPPPCRAALVNWPVEWRERWGRLANALEESGLSWQEAEARAFVEVWNQRRAETKTAALPLTTTDAERN
jgi:hypothetical protein